MTLIVCVEDRGGMAFFGRRVSRDRAVTEQILQLPGGSLRMAAYSRSLFPQEAAVCADDDFSETAAPGDRCFLELCDPAPWLEKAQQIVLFRWNRTYPYDLRFPMEQLKNWQLVSSREFCGHSHERITQEVYRKC